MIISPNAPIAAILSAIGEHLEASTKQAGLKKKDLARLADVNQNTITSVLSGGDVKLSTLIRITRVLGESDWLTSLMNVPEIPPMERLKKIASPQTPKNKPVPRALGRVKD